jgi:8-oxo-dGTP diphosphatase
MKRFGEKISGAAYRHRTGSYGVIIKNNLIGVVRPAEYDAFFLVGGGGEAGESLPETLRREASEETGFEIEIGEKIGEAVEYFYSGAEKAYIAKECHFYRVWLAGKEAEEGEHELIWITSDEIHRMHHQSHRWIIEKELDEIQGKTPLD